MPVRRKRAHIFIVPGSKEDLAAKERRARMRPTAEEKWWDEEGRTAKGDVKATSGWSGWRDPIVGGGICQSCGVAYRSDGLCRCSA